MLIVGAGIGGLAAAIRLAATGHAVTVYERAAEVGGKMRALPSEAGPVDAGPTVLTMRRVFDEVFVAAGTTLDAELHLTQETVLARHWWPDGSTLDLCSDPDQSARNIATLCGAAEARAFERFHRATAQMFDAFDAPMMQAAEPDLTTLTLRTLKQPGLIPAMLPGLSLARSLALRFRDPRLRQLFGRYATYVGGSPLASPALLSLIWQSEARGVWRVTGGMHALALTMRRLAERCGVRFHCNAPVDHLTTDQGGITGLTLENGTHIAARRVVFNGDPAALAKGMLGDQVTRAVPQKSVTPRSLSAYVWSFAAKPQGQPLTHHNVFFGRDLRSEFVDLAAGRMPQDPTLYVCAQDRGDDATPTGIERFEIIMNGPPIDVAPPPTNAEDLCRTRTFQTLAQHGLTFSPEPGIDRLTTPAGFAQLFPGSDGSLYGRSPHGMTASLDRPRARTGIKGLYLVGGGAHPGAGIPMATLSAKHAVAAIENDRISTSPSRQTAMPGGMSTA